MEHFRLQTPEARFLLYSDISSEFYERLGFAKLPRKLQLDADSTCRIHPADAVELIESKQIRVPKYF